MSSNALEDNASKKARVCRMFQLRICTRGKNCPDAHPGEEYSDSENDSNAEENNSEDEDSRKDTPVCRYFLQNKCKRGNSCPYRHPAMDDESSSEEDNKILQSHMPNEALEDNAPKNENVCRKFQLGICTLGMNCPDAHPGEDDLDREDNGDKEENFGENKDSDKKTPVCRYFLLNKCNRGEFCPFQHPESESEEEEQSGIDKEENFGENKDSDKKTPVCRYFLQNKCNRGEFCPFQHPGSESEDEEQSGMENGMNFHPCYSRLELEDRREYHTTNESVYESDLRRNFWTEEPYFETESRNYHIQKLYHEDIRSRSYDHASEIYDVRYSDDVTKHYSERERLMHSYSEETYPETSRRTIDNGQKQNFVAVREHYSHLEPDENSHLESALPDESTADFCGESESKFLRMLMSKFQESEKQKRDRSLSPENEPSKKFVREYEPAGSSSGNSSQPSEPENKTKCKYYVRGLCKRGDKCPFMHDEAVKEKLEEAKSWLKFCSRFRDGKCHDTECSLLHINKEDEHIYKTSGIISEHALANSIRLVLRLDAPIAGKKCICKDNLIGHCDVVNCPFLHYDKEQFSNIVMSSLLSKFETLFGPVKGFDDLTTDEQKAKKNAIRNTQNLILKKLFESPAPSAQPVQELPVVVPAVTLWPLPPVVSDLGHSATAEVDIDKVLTDKLLIANAKIEKENEEYNTYIRNLDEENLMMYKVLNPDQAANHLDEIRSRMLEVFEEINWKSNSKLLENARDYQHKKVVGVVPENHHVENNQFSRIHTLAPHQDEYNLYTDRLMQNFTNMHAAQHCQEQTNTLSSRGNTVGLNLWPDYTKVSSQSENSRTPAGSQSKVELVKKKLLSVNSDVDIIHPVGSQTISVHEHESNLRDDANDKCDNYENEPMEVVEDCVDSFSDTGNRVKQGEFIEYDQKKCKNHYETNEGQLSKSVKVPRISLDWAFQRHLNQFHKNTTSPSVSDKTESHTEASPKISDHAVSLNTADDEKSTSSTVQSEPEENTVHQKKFNLVSPVKSTSKTSESEETEDEADDIFYKLLEEDY